MGLGSERSGLCSAAVLVFLIQEAEGQSFQMGQMFDFVLEAFLFCRTRAKGTGSGWVRPGPAGSGRAARIRSLPSDRGSESCLDRVAAFGAGSVSSLLRIWKEIPAGSEGLRWFWSAKTVLADGTAEIGKEENVKTHNRTRTRAAL